MANFLKDVLILGEGGAGAQIVKEIMDKDKEGKYNCGLIVASDVERDKVKDIENDLVGVVQLGIDGTGKNPQLGYSACEERTSEIAELIEDYGIIFHVLGFAGGTGVGSALYIGENYSASDNVKFHYYVGAMPEYDEKVDLLENGIQGISLLEKYGRVWPIDNRKGDNSVTYKIFNKKIADEIMYVLSLPGMKANAIKKDMDTNNVLDVLFPEDYRDQGIFTLKRIELPGFKNNIPFDFLNKYDTSVSLHLDYKYFGRAGYIIKIENPNEEIEEAESYINKFKKWFSNKMPSADKIHDSVVIDIKNPNEIVIFMSGPNLTEESIRDFLEEAEKQKTKIEKAREESIGKSFTYEKKELKGFGKKEKPNPFKKSNNNIKKDKPSPFTKKSNNSILDLLGK